MMARDDFDSLMTRLTWLRFAPTDLEMHWEGLQDVPSDRLGRAINRCIKAQQDFPTPSELRSYVDSESVSMPALEDRSTPLRAPVRFQTPYGTLQINREWNAYCETCSDDGWEKLWCGPAKRHPWLSEQDCGRRFDHDGHEWARKCRCWDTNIALVSKREALRKYAAEKASR